MLRNGGDIFLLLNVDDIIVLSPLTDDTNFVASSSNSIYDAHDSEWVDLFSEVKIDWNKDYGGFLKAVYLSHYFIPGIPRRFGMENFRAGPTRMICWFWKNILSEKKRRERRHPLLASYWLHTISRAPSTAGYFLSGTHIWRNSKGTISVLLARSKMRARIPELMEGLWSRELFWWFRAPLFCCLELRWRLWGSQINVWIFDDNWKCCLFMGI